MTTPMPADRERETEQDRAAPSLGTTPPRMCERRFEEGCRVMNLSGYGDAHSCFRDAGHLGACVCSCGKLDAPTPAGPPPAPAAEPRERDWTHRTKQPATPTRTVTGDEWNAVQRLEIVERGGAISPDQARFAIKCVEDLGEAEWRDRVMSGLSARDAARTPTGGQETNG
jgi:hypothetical protein